MNDLIVIAVVLMLITLGMAVSVKATLFSYSPVWDSILVGYIFMAASTSFLLSLMGYRNEFWLVVSISVFCLLVNLGGLLVHLRKMFVLKG